MSLRLVKSPEAPKITITQGSPGRPTGSSITSASSPDPTDLGLRITSDAALDRPVDVSDTLAHGRPCMAVTPHGARGCRAAYRRVRRTGAPLHRAVARSPPASRCASAPERPWCRGRPRGLLQGWRVPVRGRGMPPGWPAAWYSPCRDRSVPRRRGHRDTSDFWCWYWPTAPAAAVRPGLQGAPSVPLGRWPCSVG